MEGGKGKERRREDRREKGKEEVGRVASENGKRKNTYELITSLCQLILAAVASIATCSNYRLSLLWDGICMALHSR